MLTAEIWDSAKRRWIKIRPRNEPLDCYTYATAAAMQPSLRIHTWKEAHWVKWEARIGLGNSLFSAPHVKENPVPLPNSSPEVKQSPVSLPLPPPAAPVRRQTVTRRITL
jgi:phage terminase large subunit GpA-like protein